jgi:hypothetical protein
VPMPIPNKTRTHQRKMGEHIALPHPPEAVGAAFADVRDLEAGHARAEDEALEEHLPGGTDVIEPGEGGDAGVADEVGYVGVAVWRR